MISEYHSVLTCWYQSTSLYQPADIRVPTFIYPLISEYQPIFSLWYIRVPACFTCWYQSTRLHWPTDIKVPACIDPLIAEYQPVFTCWYQSTRLHWPTDIKVPACIDPLISEYQPLFTWYQSTSLCLSLVSVLSPHASWFPPFLFPEKIKHKQVILGKYSSSHVNGDWSTPLLLEWICHTWCVKIKKYYIQCTCLNIKTVNSILFCDHNFSKLL